MILRTVELSEMSVVANSNLLTIPRPSVQTSSKGRLHNDDVMKEDYLQFFNFKPIARR